MTHPGSPYGVPARVPVRPRSARSGPAAGAVSVAGLLALAALLFAVWAASGDAGRRGLAPYTIDGIRYVPGEPPDYSATGIASWYGHPFHGRRTASGAVFDKERFTAAHTTLPLGTRVKVTSLENGRAVLVTVNDRGPFVDGRLIDLSHKAARRLGFAEQGLAQVRVEALVSPLR